jgi:FkbM family methyltransferase
MRVPFRQESDNLRLTPQLCISYSKRIQTNLITLKLSNPIKDFMIMPNKRLLFSDIAVKLGSFTYWMPLVRLNPKKTFLSRLLNKCFWIVTTLFLRLLTVLRISGALNLGSDENGLHVLKFNRKTYVADKGDTVFLPQDLVIFEQIRCKGVWEQGVVDFICKEIETSKCERVTLLDIGANSGIITRQVIRHAKKIDSAICVEPIPLNCQAINLNLNEYAKHVDIKIFPFALGKGNEMGTTWSEKNNLGNTSLLKLENSRGIVSKEILVRSTKEFSETYLKGCDSIFLKCDTQGYETVILSEIPKAIWKKIHAGVVEIRSTKVGTSKEVDYILEELTQYERLFWLKSPNELIYIYDIEQFWLSNSGEERDLGFSSRIKPIRV